MNIIIVIIKDFLGIHIPIGYIKAKKIGDVMRIYTTNILVPI